MLRNSLTLRLLLVSLLTLTSCSHKKLRKLPVPDIEIAFDAGPDGAVVEHLVSDTTRDIAKKDWDAQRMGYGCISQPDFGLLKAWIEKACQLVTCDPKFVKSVAKFVNKVEAIHESLPLK